MEKKFEIAAGAGTGAVIVVLLSFIYYLNLNLNYQSLELAYTYAYGIVLPVVNTVALIFIAGALCSIALDYKSNGSAAASVSTGELQEMNALAIEKYNTEQYLDDAEMFTAGLEKEAHDFTALKYYPKCEKALGK